MVILIIEMRKLYIVMVIIITLIMSSSSAAGTVLKFKAIEVKRRIQKLQLTYILPRSNLMKIVVSLKELEPDFKSQLMDKLRMEPKENLNKGG